MSHEVFVSGVGMIPFVKPGTSGTYQDMGEEAVRLALEDSGATFGNERNSGNQCQQQLFHRLDRIVSRPSGD